MVWLVSTTRLRACHDAFVSDPASVVRRYFEIVADLESSVDDLLALLHPSVRTTEHPNVITPCGAVRDRDAVAGFQAGKRLPAGTELVAHIAAMLTVEDGTVREHETFDCYEPPPAG